jgi:hypothetical protein
MDPEPGIDYSVDEKPVTVGNIVSFLPQINDPWPWPWPDNYKLGLAQKPKCTPVYESFWRWLFRKPKYWRVKYTISFPVNNDTTARSE